jgi:hypothetical protein
MAAKFYKIEGRPIIPRGWGDYGYILQHGMAAHMPIQGGKLRLERTGPYIPPISLPGIGEIVLTAQAKRHLDGSGLTGFSTETVEKVLIVELHWENWDLSAEEVPEYPESGEPEDYILGKAHSESASAALGELWEIVVPTTLTILRPRSIVSSYKELRIDVSTWTGADLVRSSDYGSVLFSEKARDWFSEHWSKYVAFDEFPTS